MRNICNILSNVLLFSNIPVLLPITNRFRYIYTITITDEDYVVRKKNTENTERIEYIYIYMTMIYMCFKINNFQNI